MSLSKDGEYVLCDGQNCEAKHKNHRFGRIKANDPDAEGGGWFSFRDGTGDFCPDHLPEWVPEWRERRNPRNIK